MKLIEEIDSDQAAFELRVLQRFAGDIVKLIPGAAEGSSSSQQMMLKHSAMFNDFHSGEDLSADSDSPTERHG